ncbi:MAG: 50S ribosomal protein L9 [Merismopedia sp. SIO2A8]|nr:50S ribosomal protein L9 [Merismopedia sp. SIO2A8]
MAKGVQVVLRQDVRKLGKEGDLVNVSPGYATNFLLPKGLAVRTTPGILKQVERRREEEAERIRQIKRDAESMKTALATIGRLTIRKQEGEDEAIFGTVTNQDVAEVIKESTGKEIERHTITVPEINKLGVYRVDVKLHPEVSATVEIQVAAL